MKIWKSIFITSFGFLVGLVLAGVGGLSAETILKRSKVENTKKIENYWSDTGLSAKEVFNLISNEKCASSKRYFQACVAAVEVPAAKAPELNERELLHSILAEKHSEDFEKTTTALFADEIPQKRASLAANIINSFLSVYFDPHTYIMPSNYFKEVSSRIDRSKFFVGISYEKRNGDFFVRKVAKNSDAEVAGLMADDKIISVNGTKLRNLKYEDMSAILKNEDETSLNFKVLRNKTEQTIQLVRSFRFLSHVQFNVIRDEKNFGLITLSKFNKGACREVSETLQAAKNENLAGVILDLRDNPGGFLDEAACVAGLFLGKNKKAYYVEYLDAQKPNEVVLTSEDQIYKGPMSVLINSATASASESLAGALQEYHRAVVVGERSFGKGTFQEPEEWVINSKISLFKTQGYYLLPSRNTTQIKGVNPNVEMLAQQASKREATYFYNPLRKKLKNYAQLKKSELDRRYTYKDCSEKPGAGTDLYLSKSLQILKCARENISMANNNSGKSTTQSF